MIVAVTGANGFIGRNLVRGFEDAGCTVRPVVRRDYEAGALEARFADVDVVVHAAGATRAPSRARLRASNVELTARTLDAATKARVRRFVFLSSQAAGGPANALEAPTRETDKPRPVEAYGQSKLEAESFVRDSALPWVVLRPAAVYGPHDRDFLSLFRLAARGLAIHPGNRRQWISIIHVDDVVRAVVCAARDAAAVGETFFLANRKPVQWQTLFCAAAECAGKQLKLDVEVPVPLVAVGAMAGDAIATLTGRASLLTSGKTALARAPFWVCSPEHVSTLLDFSASIELQRGLCDTYHWYRTNGWL
ncbi:MAG TPA: NAD-dependent epimerase/dehydratase family protein [Gemmatimonadaceae bacterium]|jgi:nucleoside-diphosphate-sugar epimerase